MPATFDKLSTLDDFLRRNDIKKARQIEHRSDKADLSGKIQIVVPKLGQCDASRKRRSRPRL
jgi:hypothetical protein